jgi:L-amino acid N-acyltransferase YncA
VDLSLVQYTDIPEIMRLYRSLIGTEGCAYNLHYPCEEDAKFDIDNGALYVLKDNDAIIGAATMGPLYEGPFSNIKWSPKNPCLVERVSVRADMQGQGIGRLIMEKIIQMAKADDFDGIVMLVAKANAQAIALYNKLDFKRCGEINIYDNDFWCYQMRF